MTTRILLAGIAVAIALASCVTPRAEDPPIIDHLGLEVPVIAPEPFDSRGQALLASGYAKVRTLPDADIDFMCQDDVAWACAIAVEPPLTPGCLIFIVSGYPAWWQAILIRHEAAHCAGWSRDHEGMRNPPPEMLP